MLLVHVGSAVCSHVGVQASGREREIVPTPCLLILGGMSSGPGGMASTRGGLISVWPCASEDDHGALSGKPMFWQPYRCTTPGC